MSEYLNKKEVLEWLKEQQKRQEEKRDRLEIDHPYWEYHEGAADYLSLAVEEFESGAFDADNSEVQRLRAAIKKAISMWHNTCDFADLEDVIEKMIACLNEALSGAREKEEPNHDAG